MSHEDEIYAGKKYWRKIKAFLAIVAVAGALGLGGLGAVLYAFHLDPDTTTTEVQHTHCPHTGCGVPHTQVSYASHEVVWSGIFFVAYLCAAGVFAGFITDR